MIASDGNSDLLGDRGDLQPAVSVLHFHLLVVGGSGGKVGCRQTHEILADIGAAGSGCLACCKCNGCVGRIIGDYIAGDGLLCAAVDLGIGVALNLNDRLLGLGDGQRAVVIGDGVVSGDRAAVYLNGSLVDDVGLAAHIGDGALFRHGESNFISIDQTHCREVRLGQGSAVINLAGVIRSKCQRNGVVNGDLVSADPDGNGLAGGVAVHHGGSIRRIQSIRLAGGQLGADGLRAGLIGSHGDGGAQQIMVNGVLRDIQLEVQLQHGGAVAAEGGGFHVGSRGIIGILAVFLVCLVGIGDGNGGIGGAGAAGGLVGGARVNAVVIHVEEFNGIPGVRVGNPDSIQVIAAIGVHTRRGTGGKNCAAGGSGAPALEGVADSGGQSRFVVALNGDQAVVCKAALGGDLVSAEVAVIGQGDGAFLHAPNGVKGHIRSAHGKLVPGDVLGCGCIGVRAPAQEFRLVGGSRKAALAENLGIRTFRVVCAVCGHVAAAAVGVIIYVDGTGFAHLGIETVVLADLGAEIEGSAACGDPAQECIALSGSIVGGGIRAHHSTVGNTCHSFDDCHIVLIVEGDGMDRSRPLGIHGDVLRRHGLAAEIVGVGSLGVKVPAVEGIAFLAGRRLAAAQRIASGGGDVCLILEFISLDRGAVADVDHIVAVAVIVEPGVIIVISVFRTPPGVAGEAGDGVAVFFCDRGIPAGAGIFMIQNVVAVQILQIVIGHAGALVTLLVEAGTAQGHHIDVGLENSAVGGNLPGAAGPFGADIGAVLGGDAQACVFSILPAVEAGRIVFVELHVIHIALIVDVHNGGAVAGNGCLGDGLCGEAGIALGNGIGLVADGVVPGFALHIGVVAVVGVLLEVDHGIAGGAGRPLGEESDVGADGSKICLLRQLLVSIPAAEGIAGALGCCGGSGSLAGGIEGGSYIRALVGFKGDPVAVFHTGGERHVAGFQRNGVNGSLAEQPAGNGLGCFHGEGHIRSGDHLAGLTGLGGNDAAGAVLEEYIEHIPEAGVNVDRLRLGDAGHDAETLKGIAAAVLPAVKQEAVLGGSGRAEQGLALFDGLLSDDDVVNKENIGAIIVFARNHRGHADEALRICGGFALGRLLFGRLFFRRRFLGGLLFGRCPRGAFLCRGCGRGGNFFCGRGTLGQDVQRQSRSEHHQRQEPRQRLT